ncbi:MAG: PHP domain-containing protein [bacterium]|nr:PHP domain-containing protein [bacterium]
MIDQSGAIHMHTTYSDGTGTWKELARFAAESKMDYAIVTDHNTLEPLHQGLEGFYGNCLVLAQTELNDADDRNHYISLDVKDDLPSNRPADELVAAVKKQNGIGIIAHPHEHRHELEYPAYPWDRWDLPYDGIELWNQLSAWKETLTRWNKLWRFVKPNLTLRMPPRETIELWDRVNQERDVIGIFGIDAHALKYRAFGMLSVTVFHYKVHFKSLRTIALVPGQLRAYPVEEAKKMLYDAYRKGRLHCVNHRLGSGIGFRFWAEQSASADPLWPGDTVPYQPGWKLTAKSPDRCKLVLIHNGSPIAETTGHELSHDVVAPGVYRIESYKKDRAWLFTNPIRMR